MSSSQVIRCSTCGANNRVSPDRLAHGDIPKCGRCGQPLPLGISPIAVTDATFEELVERSPVPVLLDLWAPWCGPCLMVAPTLDKLAAEWGGKVRIAKLNVDENPRTAMRYEARHIPLMVVLKNGLEVDRLVGVQPQNVIKSRVEQFLQPAAA